MTLLGVCIGVSAYADAQVRDLTGASRDATALWALFQDSLDAGSLRLIVDAAATVTAIRRGLDDTLGAAGPEDTVVVTFAGHGSHDHRLAVHDTSLADLANTTIGMDDLARRFRAFRAKAVLCILDCCFSGGAPARVLEDSPIPRDPGIPLASLSGEGRILIAAADVDELAYEDPRSRHGLLTKAIMDVLGDGAEVVNVAGAMSQVQDRVRAEAARLGVEQTPVFLGHIVGGLTLPVLRPGTHFWSAFPETRGARVGSAADELSAFGLAQPILAEWAERYPAGLNSLQLAAVNDFRILDGESLVVVAPTSSGKTFIGELAAARAVGEGRKAVFLFPYKALVNEKFDQFSELYADKVGLRVVRCTGDYGDQASEIVHGKYDIAVLTYEMFLSLAVGNAGLINQIGLVVLDEAQFITDPRRGITVELLLTLLLAARERGIEPQILALSAVVGDVNSFDEWLGCKRLLTSDRPVPLTEGVLDRAGRLEYLDTSGQSQVTQLLPFGAIQQRRDKPSAQDVIVPLVRKLVAAGQQVIVFRNMRGSAQGCAKYLAADLGLPPADGALSALPEGDPSQTSNDLRTSLLGGTAFHTSNLTREARAIVERNFRDPKGGVRVLAATTTVAAGINTPASTVILAEQEFMGEDGRPFTVAEYKNMAGRAGRLGYNEEGAAIILADNASDRATLFRKYVLGPLEPMRSSFEESDLDTWLVRLLVQVRSVPRADVSRLLANTFGGYLAARLRPEWRGIMERQVDGLMQRLIQLELVEEEGEDIRLMLLGRICGASGMRLQSALRLVELLRRRGPAGLTAEELMALLQGLPEPDSAYTPMFKRGAKESERVRQAEQRFGPGTVHALQFGAADLWEYYARCKRAAILWDWVRGIPLDTIETTYSTTPFGGAVGLGDVRNIADLTRMHMRSAHQIASVMFPGQGPDEGSVNDLLGQLEEGIPSVALALRTLPRRLGRGEYLRLLERGISTPDAFWQMSDADRVLTFGGARAAELAGKRPAA